MPDWNFRRVFRCLVCLILICALLVNVSPVRTKAVLVESQLLYWGVVGLVTLMTCGVFFELQNEYQLEALGRTYYDHVSVSGTSAEQLELINDFVTASAGGRIIPFRNPNSSDSGSDWLKLLGAATLSFVARFLQVNPDFIEVPKINEKNDLPYVASGSTVAAGGYIPNDSYGRYVSPDHTVIYLASYSISPAAREGYSNLSIYKAFLCPENVPFVLTYYQPDGTAFKTVSCASDIDINGVRYTYYWVDSTSSYSNGDLSNQLKYLSGYEYLEEGNALNSFINGVHNPDTVVEAITPGAIHGNLQESVVGMTGNEILSIPDIDFSSMSSEQDLIDTANKIISGEMTYEDLLNQFTGGAAPELVPLPEVNPDIGGGSDPTEPVDPDATSPTNPDQEGYPGTGETPETPEVPDPGGNPGQNPGIGTNPDPGTGTDPDTGTDTDPDTDPNPNPNPDTGTDQDTWKPSSGMNHFTLDLKQYFPFCIPFDLYAFFTCLNADPVAPVIDWIIPMPGGGSYPFQIDLSVFDSVAQTLRRLQLLLFCVGLAFKTRDLIKG